MTTKIKSTSIDSANTFSFSNVVITGAITANSVAGVPSQVLSYDGSKVYWSGDAGIGRPYIGTVYIANSTWHITGSQDQYSVGQGQPVISNYNSTSSAGFVKIVGTGFKSGCNVYFDSVDSTIPIGQAQPTSFQIPSANVTFYNSSEIRVTLPFFSNFTTSGTNTTITIVNTDSSFCKLRDAVFVHNESDAMWSFGGSTGLAASSYITRIDFSDNTTTNITTKLPITCYGVAGASDKIYGYTFGGITITNITLTSIHRIVFSGETVVTAGSLPIATYYGTAATNGINAYIYGGIVANAYASNMVLKWNYANASIGYSGFLPLVTENAASMYNKNYGWCSGGRDDSAQYISSIVRHDFSADLYGIQKQTNLSTARWGHATASNKTYGYFISGYNTGYLTSVERMTFSSSTVSTIGSRPAAAVFTGAGENSLYCWTQGSQYGTSSTVTYRMDFSTESYSTAGYNGLYYRKPVSGRK